ncbi:MAG TPA: glycosyltransferase family 87 protein, partial [Bacteroidota bacterium]
MRQLATDSLFRLFSTHYGRITGVTAILAGCFFWGKTFIVLSEEPHQHDFRIYYDAVELWNKGGNPYGEPSLGTETRDSARFAYPPFTLLLFYPFTLFERETAALFYLSLKVAALLVLLALWDKFLLPNIFSRGLLLWFSAIGFNSAARLDILSGNIALFEQLLIWSSIGLFLAKRPGGASWILACSSTFKFVPVLLSPVYLFLAGRRAAWKVLLPFLLLGALVGISWIFNPALWENFVSSIAGLDERGHTNPASLAFFRDLADEIGIPALGVGLYVVLAGLIACAIIKTLSAGNRLDLPHRDLVFYSL